MLLYSIRNFDNRTGKKGWPSGDPSAYFIRGAAIAIRKKDASEVLVRLLGGEQNGK